MRKSSIDELGVEHLGVDPYELAGRGRLGEDLDVGRGGVELPPQGDALHAKLVVLEAGKRSRVVVGSANATEAAWGRRLTGEGKNVEVTAILDGRSSAIGVRSLLDGADAPWKEFLVPYLPGESDEERKLDRRMETDLQNALSSIIAAGPKVTWSREGENWRADLTFVAYPPEMGVVAANVRPMSRSEAEAFRSLSGSAESLRWDGCSITEVTAWFVIRAATERSGLQLEWERVLLVPMQAAPPQEREAAAMRRIVGDGRGILRFLARLAGADGEWGAARGRLFGPTCGEPTSHEDSDLTIQDLLRAVAEADSRRFQELDDVVRSFTGADLGSSALPEGFERVWAAMRSAMERSRG